jgi:hypothetical protein
VNLDEILYGGDDIEDDLDSILLNSVASTVQKWRTFKLLRWVQLLNRLVYLDGISRGCRKSRHFIFPELPVIYSARFLSFELKADSFVHHLLI